MSTPSNKLTLKSSDGEMIEVDRAVALESVMIKNMIEVEGENDLILPLPNVKGRVLSKVIEYCKKHSQTPSDAGADLKAKLNAFDDEFVKLDRKTLLDLLMASNYLNIPGLFDLVCKAMADNVKDETVEEFRKIFNYENDLSEEDELKLMQEEQVFGI